MVCVNEFYDVIKMILLGSIFGLLISIALNVSQINEKMDVFIETAAVIAAQLEGITAD